MRHGDVGNKRCNLPKSCCDGYCMSLLKRGICWFFSETMSEIVIPRPRQLNLLAQKLLHRGGSVIQYTNFDDLTKDVLCI